MTLRRNLRTEVSAAVAPRGLNGTRSRRPLPLMAKRGGGLAGRRLSGAENHAWAEGSVVSRCSLVQPEGLHMFPRATSCEKQIRGLRACAGRPIRQPSSCEGSGVGARQRTLRHKAHQPAMAAASSSRADRAPTRTRERRLRAWSETIRMMTGLTSQTRALARIRTELRARRTQMSSSKSSFSSASSSY